MLVKLPQTLTISENYNYGRLVSCHRVRNDYLFQQTYIHLYLLRQKSISTENLLSKIILDDGYVNQNRRPWLPQSFSATNSLRSGDQLKNIEGILEYCFNGWRIQPIQDVVS